MKCMVCGAQAPNLFCSAAPVCQSCCEANKCPWRATCTRMTAEGNYHATWQRDNRDKVNAYQRRRRAENLAKTREYHRNYRVENRVRINAQQRRRYHEKKAQSCG